MSQTKKRDLSSEEKLLQRKAIERIKEKNEIEYKKTHRKKTAFIETYGCQQNVSDSEVIMGMLSDMGYEKASSRDDADIILFNTCAVREGAEMKVFGNLGALKHLKAKRPSCIIGVCGCMMQQKENADAVRKKYRHIDLVFGTHSLYFFPSLLEKLIFSEERVIDVKDTEGYLSEEYAPRRAGGPSAWVSVMYGCNNFCSYCIVPYVRGRERSRDASSVVREVEALSKEGYKEVTLLGQNVNSYGKDLEENIDFADLLRMVCKVDGIERVRFMTSHPKAISEKLIDTMAEEKKNCAQLHLPVQSGSTKVLRDMNRHYTREEYLEKLAKVKAKIPNITLTTDIIVGFPTETKEDFEETLSILTQVRYDTIFSFIYSKRPGTPAAVMADAMTKEEKKECFERMLKVQEKISYEKNLALLDKEVEVLTEGRSKTDLSMLTGRTEGGKIVNFKGDDTCIGNFVKLRITDVKTWSLTGEII